MRVEYSQGIGHVPGYNAIAGRRGLTNDQWSYRQELEGAAETGKYPNRHSFYCPRIPLPGPSAADFLHSIVMDNPHDESFEDWAANLGYDSDSRRAEEIWRACIKQTRGAESVLGKPLLAEIAKLLEDY